MRTGDIDIIEEHIIIRETVGYKEIEQVPVQDIPRVLQYLRIVHNYLVMLEIEKK